MLPKLRETSVSYSESGINDVVLFRDVHVPVALFQRWEHRGIVPCLISAKEQLIEDWTLCHFGRCHCSWDNSTVEVSRLWNQIPPVHWDCSKCH